MAQRGAYVAVGLAHPCMPLTGEMSIGGNPGLHTCPCQLLWPGTPMKKFSRSRRLQHLCLVSFVACFVFVPSVEQPQESC